MCTVTKRLTPPRGRRDATRVQILDAALSVFTRYGFARVSMSDIAEAARLSRTSLYNHYPTKEDVWRALNQRINDEVAGAVRSAASGDGEPSARLHAIMEAWVSWAFELLRSSPHGRELIDEKDRICAETTAETNALFEKLVARTLSAAVGRPRATALGERAAPLVIAAVKGVLHEADDAERMRTGVHELLDILIAGLRAAR
jgi:AcrR family transcriptional regulator